jgi:putative nucleotidyltransferase with HDIG domain
MLYRVRQLIAALRAQVSPEEQALVAATLSPAEQRLFAAMPRYDQRHCLDVYWTLRRAQERDELILRAALFHDCGKVADDGAQMPLIYYMLVTLLKLAPPLYRAAAASGRGPLRHVRIYAEHAWRGAHMAAAAGSPPEIVAMIRHYHDLYPTGRAAVLQWADEQN